MTWRQPGCALLHSEPWTGQACPCIPVQNVCLPKSSLKCPQRPTGTRRALGKSHEDSKLHFFWATSLFHFLSQLRLACQVESRNRSLCSINCTCAFGSLRDAGMLTHVGISVPPQLVAIRPLGEHEEESEPSPPGGKLQT